MTIGHEMCLLLIEMQYIHQSCRFNDFRKKGIKKGCLLHLQRLKINHVKI